MKKLVVLLLALTMLFSCAAISVGAEDKIIESDGKTWKVVSEDLLYNSGYGDPATVEEEGFDLNNGNWFGHESWNPTQGWMGFSGGSDYGAGVAIREVVTTTLSNGSQGKAIRFAAPTDIHCGSQFGLENVDLVCEFEDGKIYIAEVVEKISLGFNGNGHKPIIAFNQTECEDHTTGVVTPVVDGEWHTYYSLPFENVAANWNVDGRKDEDGNVIGGVFLDLGVGENWIQPGTEFFYESVKIYEVEEYTAPETGDASLVVVAVISVALAAAVVFTKKRSTAK
ncbi:MAG: hypothetical protein II748_06555 [Clostridia bacterium]|nr:hypothetical protein [Clostridia bacterium]